MNTVVIDPFGVAGDPVMPTLALALNPHAVRDQFGRKLRRWSPSRTLVDPMSIEVIRYKPGRRCVIEYRIGLERSRGQVDEITLIGKVRANRYGKSGYRRLKSIWQAGFQDYSHDGISVPEPVGTIGKFQMWLQRKVPGRVATELLAGAEGPAIARRVADAAHKLHRTNVQAEATHDIHKELRILHDRLPVVLETFPRLRTRIVDLLQACDQLGRAARPNPFLPIHRDFYADQIVVDGDRITILDFDLFCAGDPAVDIGNFLGHVVEQSVRTFGGPSHLREIEDAL